MRASRRKYILPHNLLNATINIATWFAAEFLKGQILLADAFLASTCNQRSLKEHFSVSHHWPSRNKAIISRGETVQSFRHVTHEKAGRTAGGGMGWTISDRQFLSEKKAEPQRPRNLEVLTPSAQNSLVLTLVVFRLQHGKCPKTAPPSQALMERQPCAADLRLPGRFSVIILPRSDGAGSRWQNSHSRLSPTSGGALPWLAGTTKEGGVGSVTVSANHIAASACLLFTAGVESASNEIRGTEASY